MKFANLKPDGPGTIQRDHSAAAAILLGLFLCGSAAGGETVSGQPWGGNFAVERDADVAVAQDGPHEGGGPFVFKKRVLHPGSAIGLHTQRENEIYYVLSGSGRYTMDDRTIEVGPGMALLTRPGGAHALVQTGTSDLVLIIVYPRH
jgi:mannose-6-phosphate isomerase-like protein (cupin superfamily)